MAERETMQRLLLVTITIAFLSVPFGLADQTSLGTPDSSCQTPAHWNLHDYGGPSPGNAVFGRRDGSAEDCGAGTPGDSHSEYAIGGGFLAAETGDGFSSGSLACLGEVGHHQVFPVVEVQDLVSFEGQYFVVTADYSREGTVPPGSLDCGDNLAEVCNFAAHPGHFPQPLGSVVDTVNAVYVSLVESPGTTCNPLDQAVVGYGSVRVSFPPGIDGTYNVFIGQGGVQGHISTRDGEANRPGDLPYVCPGHGAYSSP